MKIIKVKNYEEMSEEALKIVLEVVKTSPMRFWDLQQAPLPLDSMLK